MRNILVVSLCLLFVGCMSNTLKSYVGLDVREVMLDMGPPDNAFDMGDGRRAFQWVQDRVYTDPMTVTSVEASKEGRHVDWVSSVSTISGGRSVSAPCHYTVYGRWDETLEGWMIEDYKRPSLECE